MARGGRRQDQLKSVGAMLLGPFKILATSMFDLVVGEPCRCGVHIKFDQLNLGVLTAFMIKKYRSIWYLV